MFKVEDTLDTAKKVLENVRIFCYFGSDNYSNQLEIKDKFSEFLVTANSIIPIAKVLYKLYIERESIQISDDFQKNDKSVKAIKKLGKSHLEYLTQIPQTECYTEIFGKKVFLFEFPFLFTQEMHTILKALNLNPLENIPVDQLRHIETFIASYRAIIEDIHFQDEYISLVGSHLENNHFFNEIYISAMKCLVYGYGNCELLAYLSLIELIRIGSEETLSSPLSCIRLNPLGEEGKKLEELNFLAIGNWPNEDCLIICPWLQKQNPIFHWQGSLEKTSEISKLYSSLDMENTSFTVTFSCSVKETQKFKQVINAHHQQFLDLRKENLLKTRRLFCDFLENFNYCKEPIKGLRQMIPGPYFHRYELDTFKFFSTNEKTISDEKNTSDNLLITMLDRLKPN